MNKISISLLSLAFVVLKSSALAGNGPLYFCGYPNCVAKNASELSEVLSGKPQESCDPLPNKSELPTTLKGARKLFSYLRGCGMPFDDVKAFTQKRKSTECDIKSKNYNVTSPWDYNSCEVQQKALTKTPIRYMRGGEFNALALDGVKPELPIFAQSSNYKDKSGNYIQGQSVDCGAFVSAAMALSGLNFSPNSDPYFRMTSGSLSNVLVSKNTCFAPLEYDDQLKQGDMLLDVSHVAIVNHIGPDPFHLANLPKNIAVPEGAPCPVVEKLIVSVCRTASQKFRDFDISLIHSTSNSGHYTSTIDATTGATKERYTLDFGTNEGPIVQPLAALGGDRGSVTRIQQIANLQCLKKFANEYSSPNGCEISEYINTKAIPDVHGEMKFTFKQAVKEAPKGWTDPDLRGGTIIRHQGEKVAGCINPNPPKPPGLSCVDCCKLN